MQANNLTEGYLMQFNPRVHVICFCIQSSVTAPGSVPERQIQHQKNVIHNIICFPITLFKVSSLQNIPIYQDTCDVMKPLFVLKENGGHFSKTLGKVEFRCPVFRMSAHPGLSARKHRQQAFSGHFGCQLRSFQEVYVLQRHRKTAM